MSEKITNEKIILTTLLTSEEETNIKFKEKRIIKKEIERGALANNNECSICFKEITEKAKILGCMHKFCLDCFTSWQKANKNTTCPNCRETPKIYFTTSEDGSISKVIKKMILLHHVKNAIMKLKKTLME